MKFLLTSGGISNDSIRNALLDLLGKPIAESSALFLPTALYAMPGGATIAWRLIRGLSGTTPLCDLGWKSLGLLELTALPSIKQENWVPLVQEAEALLVPGGDNRYFCYWMWQSGLADLLPSLRRETVYVGVSGGSMVVTPTFGGPYDDGTKLPTGSDQALRLVDFALSPHLDDEELKTPSPTDLEQWAASADVPVYAIDDQTAIKVVDGVVEVISEGHWKLFTHE
ncbi:MAG TPA: Type 1 glutamine amidotransferase-like domain-containing protein [Ktedonobacterales bacterium]|nr:Type 1 glutamine amidotransferase-like domain-containing protein [Ktedonobacterales bacterium]